MFRRTTVTLNCQRAWITLSAGMNNPSLICGKGSICSDPYQHNSHVQTNNSDAELSAGMNNPVSGHEQPFPDLWEGFYLQRSLSA